MRASPLSRPRTRMGRKPEESGPEGCCRAAWRRPTAAPATRGLGSQLLDVGCEASGGPQGPAESDRPLPLQPCGLGHETLGRSNGPTCRSRAQHVALLTQLHRDPPPPSPGRGFSNQQPKSKKAPGPAASPPPTPCPLRHVADLEICLSLHQCSHWWSGQTTQAAWVLASSSR